MVDCWQKEDYYFDEPSDSSKSKRSPVKKGTCSGIKKFIKKIDIGGSPKKEVSVQNDKMNIIMDLHTERYIDTITLSDSDDSEEKSKPCSPKKKKSTKHRKQCTNTSLNTSKKELCEMSGDEGREQEKENIASELNGETDEDVEYLDEKEKILRDRIRTLPLF